MSSRRKQSNFFWWMTAQNREYYPLDDRNEVDPDFDDYSLSEDVFIEEPYRAKSTVLSEKVVRGYQNKENGSD